MQTAAHELHVLRYLPEAGGEWQDIPGLSAPASSYHAIAEATDYHRRTGLRVGIFDGSPKKIWDSDDLPKL